MGSPPPDPTPPGSEENWPAWWKHHRPGRQGARGQTPGSAPEREEPRQPIPPSTLHSGAHSLPASEPRLVAVQGPSRVMGAPSIYTLINADKEGCVQESGRTQHSRSVSLKPLPTRSGDVCITFGMGAFF